MLKFKDFTTTDNRESLRQVNKKQFKQEMENYVKSLRTLMLTHSEAVAIFYFNVIPSDVLNKADMRDNFRYFNRVRSHINPFQELPHSRDTQLNELCEKLRLQEKGTLTDENQLLLDVVRSQKHGCYKLFVTGVTVFYESCTNQEKYVSCSDLRARVNTPKTLLQKLVEEGRTDECRTFLQKKVFENQELLAEYINLQGEDHNTALHIAILNRDDEITGILDEFGAERDNEYLKNKSGYTPRELYNHLNPEKTTQV
mmetsp:Transcript_8248/g.9440  ORF Transcript_8248/g.9440 Transcript_8248/m.9440 type:complete len:256 (-) Transcript_8248:867-1634(-)